MALSEASHVLRMIDGQQLSYPVYLDMEDNSTRGVGSEMLGNIASTFCAAIKDAGYDVGIYSNTSWFNNVLIDPRFDSLSKWVAQYMILVNIKVLILCGNIQMVGVFQAFQVLLI